MSAEIISIEKALNSRCSYGFAGDSGKHWGIFRKEKPDKKIVDEIILNCKVPQYSYGKLLLWLEGEYLFLGFEKTRDLHKQKLLHIESGMQQEAVYLACTALGVGTCIRNLGVNGTDYGDKTATARHLFGEIEGSYRGSKYSTNIPGPEMAFRKGEYLPEPKRDSEIECLQGMKRLSLTRERGSSAGEKEVSQVLWAARGRTPHYVKGKPWGLTIPTWGGAQEYDEVCLIKKGKLFRYVNWKTFLFSAGNPTHDLQFVKDLKGTPETEGYSYKIILCKRENTSRSLWEIGYMLENMLLQAGGLELSFKTKFLENSEVLMLTSLGIPSAQVMLLL